MHPSRDRRGNRSPHRQSNETFRGVHEPRFRHGKTSFFAAEYDSSSKAADGGGAMLEGEDIEVLELGVEQIKTMLSNGKIKDAKTIMLLQHALLHGFFSEPSAAEYSPA